MRTYEIPISCGAGSVTHSITTTKRTLVLPGESNPDGSMSVKSTKRIAEKRLPLSVTLTARSTKGDTSEALTDRVQHVEPFKSAIAKRHLKVLPVAEQVDDPSPEDAALELATKPSAPTPSPTLPGKSDEPNDTITTTSPPKASKRGQ